LGGFEFLAVSDLVIALTGAVCPLRIDAPDFNAADLEEHLGFNCTVRVPAGVSISLGLPKVGARTYLALRGAIAGIEDTGGAVLGSLATDTLSGLGPQPLTAGMGLFLGQPQEPLPWIDLVAPPPMPGPKEPAKVRVLPGPRLNWCADAMDGLASTSWTVDANSNRVAVRLRGVAIERVCHDELPPEGLVPGAVQIPPNGMPVVFGPDHPTTGGYPVVAVVHPDDLWVLAQLRPGQPLRMVNRPTMT
jgi:allophanate hydrolase subunit 2